MKPRVLNTVFYIIIIGLTLVIGYSYSKQSSLNSDVKSLNKDKADLQSQIEQLKKDIESKNQIPDDIKFLPETVVLNIPGYKQQHKASCEFAATSATLKYFGKNFTEEQIHQFIGVDSSPRFFDDQGNLHWGNPQEKYVGDIDAKVVYVDGYGVYNKPIYRFLENHGFSKSISKTEWELSELLDYVREGYPAIVWISNDYLEKQVGTMIAPDGTENPWIDKEHAVVIRGVDKDNIYIMDVGYGSHYTVSYSKFTSGFKNLDNMGIVVVPD